MTRVEMFPRLFERGKIGPLELKNRVIKAPQSTAFGARDGSVTDRIIRHYKDVARGGAGLVIVEYAWVDNNASKGSRGQLGIADDESVPGLAFLAQAIQENGAKAALQIVHNGRQKMLGTLPIKAPSRVPWEELYLKFGAAVVPEELTCEEIQQIIGAFGDAARRARLAGFDLVEVHGGHGYLITGFLSPRTNKRTDWYGGSLENRMRFLTEVVKNIRAKVGADFPLSVRLSGTEYEPDGVMIEDTVETARVLEKLGVDVIHVSGGNHHQMQYEVSPMSMPLAPHVWAAERVKKEVRIPVIASGSITTPALAEAILENGKADFISLGRPLWADPYWPKKAREGRPEDIRPCIRCNDGCMERFSQQLNAVSCSVNVTLGKEGEIPIIPAERPKKVVVVGGGPAGMEAALVCALRGHKVTIFEKRKLGGVLNEASVPEFKADLRRLVDYYRLQIEKLKIQVVRENATMTTIRDGGFEAAIVAVGARQIRPDIPGIDNPRVSSALEVLIGKVSFGSKIVVIGGGLVAAEVGLFLAEQGKEVVFVVRRHEFMEDVPFSERSLYRERLNSRKVKIHTGSQMLSISDRGAVIADKYGAKEEILADNIVLGGGFAPQTELKDQVEKEMDIEVYPAGDCVNPRRVWDAVHEGNMAARWL